MISFKSFVNAIHDAILAANDSLMEKNTGLLDKYFENTSNEDELQSALNDALQSSKAITDKKGSVSKEDLRDAVEAFEKAKNALSNTDSSTSDSSSARMPGALSPKSVVVEYPHQTSNGIEFIEVHVPLITLSPLSMSQIEKATLTANFEMQIVNDELQLMFSNGSKNRFRRKSKLTRGTLELTLAPQETSEGLKLIIEGYERALKAQIPH